MSENKNNNKNCPDCDREMTQIRLIDKVAHGVQHRPFEYALRDAKPGKWTDRFPIKGRIAGMMCDECGRVMLYAELAEK